MTNGDDNAYTFCSFDNEGRINEVSFGLTKREYFAAMAMQGLFARGDRDAIEMKSVLYAEALINELNKQP